MKYKINVTTNNGEVLDILKINTDEKYWNSQGSKRIITEEIFDEIERHEENNS